MRPVYARAAAIDGSFMKLHDRQHNRQRTAIGDAEGKEAIKVEKEEGKWRNQRERTKDGKARNKRKDAL